MVPTDDRPPAPIAALRISSFTATWAGAQGRQATLHALRNRRSGLRPNDFGPAPVPTCIGRVGALESAPLPERFAQWECRNNRLAWMALQQDDFIEAVTSARLHYGAERVAVVLGTSTSSIGATEEAYRSLLPDGQFPPALRRPIVHEPHSTGDFVQHALGLTGVCVTVATACSSSAKVFGQAERLMRAGLADAVVVGGVDSLCGSVLFGFNSLELLSAQACRPFDRRRDGINLGEAGGFALLESTQGPGPWLLGYGDSSDAHHMSSPDPEGVGARLALRDALARAGCSAGQVDYINLHGTASQKNDEMEARLVAEQFTARTLASSTKGFSGHALGAAGILESVITLLALDAQFVPGTLHCEELDPVCGPQIQRENRDADLLLALNFSFGFGGSNCVVMFGRERPE